MPPALCRRAPLAACRLHGTQTADRRCAGWLDMNARTRCRPPGSISSPEHPVEPQALRGWPPPGRRDHRPGREGSRRSPTAPSAEAGMPPFEQALTTPFVENWSDDRTRSPFRTRPLTGVAEIVGISAPTICGVADRTRALGSQGGVSALFVADDDGPGAPRMSAGVDRPGGSRALRHGDGKRFLHDAGLELRDLALVQTVQALARHASWSRRRAPRAVRTPCCCSRTRQWLCPDGSPRTTPSR